MSNYVIDNTFGVRTVHFGTGRDSAYSVVELTDGYILSGPVAGTSIDFGSVKLDKITGQLVSSFGTNGLIRTGFPGNGTRTDVPVISIVDRTTDTFYVGGSAQFGATGTNNLLFAIAKYDKNGALATDYGTDINGQFNGQGLTYIDADPNGVNDEIFGMQIDSNGRLVGTGFSNPGVVVGAGPAFNFGTARYMPNGVLDNTFGTNGTVITDFEVNNDDRANDLLIRKNGDIIIGGRTKSVTNPNFNYALVSLDKKGRVNKNFGQSACKQNPNLSTEPGKVINNFGNNDLIIKLVPAERYSRSADCKLIAFDNFEDFYAVGRSGSTRLAFMVVKYNKNGCVDNTFGTNGVLRFNFEDNSSDTLNSAFVDEFGHLYLVGNSNLNGRNRFAIARVTPDGVVDDNFGKRVYNFDGITSGFFRDGKVDSNQSIILCGEAVVTGSTSADFIAVKLVRQ